jgi:hypothetical protein
MGAKWKCCGCAREVDEDLNMTTCPDCYHEKCDLCTQISSWRIFFASDCAGPKRGLPTIFVTERLWTASDTLKYLTESIIHSEGGVEGKGYGSFISQFQSSMLMSWKETHTKTMSGLACVLVDYAWSRLIYENSLRS